MNIKHITTGLLMTMLIAPTTIIAYETYGFSYEPTDPDQYTTVSSVDDRISELDDMIAALEAEKQGLVTAREALLNQDDVRSMINELLKQIALLQGEFSDAPAESELRDDLLQQIDELLIQVAELQAALGNPTPPKVCPYTWTRNLSRGDSGADVRALQQFLNADPDTKISNGPGTYSTEPDEYHPGVAAAISKFQVKYRYDVLSPQNLVNPTGTFDERTRAKANSLCVAAPTQPDETNVVLDTDGDGWIYGSNENDSYQGTDAENIMVGSAGDDIMEGNGDWDEVNYIGRTDCINDFTISKNNDGSVTINSRKYGTDTLRNIEGAYFAGCGDWITL